MNQDSSPTSSACPGPAASPLSVLSNRPRAHLGRWPTPLEECPRLSAVLGGPHIWVKRDDLTTLGLGGNKVRKLEFLLGDAIRQGADTIITVGAIQSNHARLTAAACRYLGLDVVLILADEALAGGAGPPSPPQGNLLLDRLFGAELVFVPEDTDEAIDAAFAETAERLRRRGRHPYIVPMGGSNAVGTLGYVSAAFEIADQAKAEDVSFDHIFVTTGSCGTHAGLHLGAAIALPRAQVHGVTVSRDPGPQAERVGRLAAEAAALLGVDPASLPAPTVHGGYVGEGYAIATPAGWEAIIAAARTEALVLDPVYTGKTMSGLIGLIREGKFPTTSKVLFVHTGGWPGLLAQASDFQKYLASREDAGRA